MWWTAGKQVIRAGHTWTYMIRHPPIDGVFGTIVRMCIPSLAVARNMPDSAMKSLCPAETDGFGLAPRLGRTWFETERKRSKPRAWEARVQLVSDRPRVS